MIKEVSNLNSKKNIICIICFVIFLMSSIIMYLINLNKENVCEKIEIIETVNYKIDEANIDKDENTYLIAEYKTKFNQQNANRSTNIMIATEKINNVIVLPNEIFSYNEVVGNRTEEVGFKVATVYQDGKVADGIGGGICQVSSTLYNAVMYANLTIIERRSHLFLPSYISTGRDATVADEYIDFKFKNTRKYPVKIVASANEGVVDIKIYGKRQEDECDVEIETINTEIIPYKVIYEKDNDMCKGREEIIQKRKEWI